MTTEPKSIDVLGEFKATRKRERAARSFHLLLGVLIGVTVCGVVVAASGCCWGEGALWEPTFRGYPTVWAVP